MLLNMFDKVLYLLGPDSDIVVAILTELVEKHAARGVKKEMFPILRESPDQDHGRRLFLL